MPKRNYTSTAGEKTIANVGGISNSATEITLDSLTNLPASYPYTLVIDPDVTNKEEIVLVTSAGANPNSLTIVRGSTPYTGSASFVGNYNGGDGTAAVAHDFGAKVKHMITARDLQEPQTHIFSSQDVHGLTGTGNQGGDVVGTNKTQTLTNKTISSANNTLTIQSSDVSGLSTLLDAKANLASPTFTGTVVLPSTTSIGNVSNTEISYLDGVTSAIQTQLNSKEGTLPSQTGNSGKYLTTNGTALSWGTVTAGSGTVTSITAGTGLTGGTITTSGTIAVDTATVATTTNAVTLTNKTLTSPTVSGLYLSDSSIVFEGSSADANETTLTVTNPTADRTITLPNATGTVVLGTSAMTLTTGTVDVSISSGSGIVTVSNANVGTTSKILLSIVDDDANGQYIVNAEALISGSFDVYVKHVSSGSISGVTITVHWLAIG